jgi:hypothetical protein
MSQLLWPILLLELLLTCQNDVVRRGGPVGTVSQMLRGVAVVAVDVDSTVREQGVALCKSG